MADFAFSWVISDFKPICNTIYFSPHFATSMDPQHGPWYLYLSVISEDTIQRLTNDNETNGKNIIGLRFMCRDNASDPVHVNFDISIMSNTEKMYSKSYKICSRSDNFIGYYSFIELENLMKWVENDELDILVEMFFKEKEEHINLTFSTDLKFLSDIEFSIEGQKFFTHKAFLAAKSQYFYKFFQENKDVQEIDNLNGIKPNIFNEILNYICSGKIKDWSLSQDILMGANFLQIDDLKSECAENLCSQVTAYNVSSLLILAHKCNASRLKSYCITFILKNFDVVGKSSDFQCLKTDGLLLFEVLNVILRNDEKIMFIRLTTKFPKEELSTSNTCCHLASKYESFLNNEDLSDIKIRIGNKIFFSHKLVLAASSTVFYGMLTCNMKEALDNLIEIQDIEEVVFNEVLRYIYTGKVENLEKYGSEILIVADKYCLDQLKEICEDFLAKNLTISNVVNIVKIADTHNASFLRRHCIFYILASLFKKLANVKILEPLCDNHSNILFEILNVFNTHFTCYVIHNVI